MAGRPSKDRGSRFQLYLPDDLHRDLRVYCADSGKPLSDVIVKVMTEWWDRQPEKETYRSMRAAKPAEPKPEEPAPKGKAKKRAA